MIKLAGDLRTDVGFSKLVVRQGCAKLQSGPHPCPLKSLEFRASGLGWDKVDITDSCRCCKEHSRLVFASAWQTTDEVVNSCSEPVFINCAAFAIMGSFVDNIV